MLTEDEILNGPNDCECECGGPCSICQEQRKYLNILIQGLRSEIARLEIELARHRYNNMYTDRRV